MQIIQSKEEFVRFLGEGSFGCVNLVRYSNPNDGSSYLSAVKNLPKKTMPISKAKSFSRSGKKLYKLQLEFASEGSLSAFMDNYTDRKLPEPLIKDFTWMILEGLVSVHGHGYAHCDIKPDNLLVFPCSSSEGYEIKISDFGSALEVGDVPKFWETNMPWMGTPFYMSLESVRDGVAEMSVDLWSVGCLVLEMYTGVIPWEGVNLHLLATLLCCGEAPEIPESLPSDAKDFNQTCFSREPEERGSATELMSHPFLSRPQGEENRGRENKKLVFVEVAQVENQTKKFQQETNDRCCCCFRQEASEVDVFFLQRPHSLREL
ncbi:hypothetical protein Bca52824_074742 [Brassica carinata]|uniref:Protein kinase domain-containing protein n=1 Tax=Brassica carinata TaxID=52824 RepID=A0A8X7PQS1_BRACI|nr:hypothetical protein Bca52824_074742 [Brassica carinata]